MRDTPSGTGSDTGSDTAVDNVLGQQVLGDFRPSDLIGTAAGMLTRGALRPHRFATASAGFVGSLPHVLAGATPRQPPRGDRRFVDPAWSENPFFSRLLQGYLALHESLEGYADDPRSTAKQSERHRFLMTQVGNALAPTNFLLSNPTALRTAYDTRGASLLQGARNFLDDARHRRPIPSQVDESAFTVGENLAATPGSVVLRTEMFELIQYAPQTPKVRQKPILIVPSIVNKFYVFDLAPERSVIEFLVRHELTVFVLAWRNPQRRHDRWGMADYQDAVERGIDAAQSITRAKAVNLWAVCGAGPVVTSLAGHLAAVGSRKINSLMLVVSPLDTAAMSEAPSIGAFMDNENAPVPTVVGEVAKGRRISARDFTLLFAMLRSNELIWHYWVDGYLLGKKPPPFDVLYWNADGTGMTARFNADFNDFVERNPLVETGAMSVRGKPIADVARLGFDSYVLGAKRDHLVVWQGVYRSAQMLGPRTVYVLGNSGHIQTIVSPPGNPKASFLAAPATASTATGWLEGAEAHQGSWWPHYVTWVTERSGRLINAPAEAGDAEHPPLGVAPGDYVHERA